MVWDYTKINQEVTAQATALLTNRGTIRLLKDALVSIPVVTTVYSCDGVVAGTVGDGVDRLTADGAFQYGNGVTPRSWIVLRYAGIDNVQTLLWLSANATFAEITLGQLRFVALVDGAGGNDIRIALIGDQPPAGGVTVNVTGNNVTIHYESGVSTPAQVVTAMTGSALLATTALGATALTAPASDTGGFVRLEGGADTDGAGVAMEISMSGSYSGGTATARPTAPDSVPGPAFQLNGANLGNVLHVLNTTTGDDIRIILYALLDPIGLDWGFTDDAVTLTYDLGNVGDSLTTVLTDAGRV